jgi:uncharacterized paraquat-inducible protein A
VTIAPERTPEASPAADEAPRRCARCEATLAEAQEWCLECGARATPLLAPRGWLVPLAVVAVVVLLVAAAFVIALINLSG